MHCFGLGKQGFYNVVETDLKSFVIPSLDYILALKKVKKVTIIKTRKMIGMQQHRGGVSWTKITLPEQP